MGAVEAALGRVAEKLAVSPIEAARGIVRIANNNMINALKLVSLNRGYDPRDFTLVAFGGGGAMHAAALGAELGVKKVVIPRGAPVFSAWGMMMSDLRRDYFITRLIETAGAEASTVAESLSTLIEEAALGATTQFAAEGVERGQVKLTPFLKCRYQNQEHSVEVELRYGPLSGVTVQDLISRFHAVYEREYTYRLDAPVEIVGLHLVASAEVGKLQLAPAPKTGATLAAARKAHRIVDYALEGAHEADIYDAERLEPGMSFAGPAVIEDPATTVVVHPGQSVSIDDYGNVHIEMAR
jgi:N-methylhydantoinase A